MIIYVATAIATLVLLVLLTGKWAPFTRQLFRRPWFLGVELWFLVVNPLLFLGVLEGGASSSCCELPPYFAPTHRLSIQVFVAGCVLCYFLLRARPALGPPLAEALLNAGVLGGLCFNLLLIFHLDFGFWLYGNLPVGLLLLRQLRHRHRLAHAALASYTFSDRAVPRWALRILLAPVYEKAPWLAALCLPLLTVLWVGLLLLGQAPDAFVRAFTDTYRHGLSQLACDYANCPDQHFLCTIAAEGHPALVQPLRFGERQGRRIRVNRQLLVANAFEELLAEHCPRLHREVRWRYNRLGRACRRGFERLRIAWVADAVYVAMKPLEWLFLLVLYSAEQQPENRIARQYLSGAHRQLLQNRPAA